MKLHLLFVSSFVPIQALARKCSGRGQIYSQESPTFCQCEPCYKGDVCQHLDHKCKASVNIVELTFLQDYWNNQTDAAVTIDAGYRMPYEKGSEATVFAPNQTANNNLVRLLDLEIRTLHETVGNVVTEGYYIVPGLGATCFMSGAMFAHSTLAAKDLNVYARPPYYNGFKEMADNFFGHYAHFNTSTAMNPASVLEFVTYPNNPDGMKVLDPHYATARVAYDLVYYWPSYTEVNQKLDLPFAFFSLGKLAGFAGSHFGWAVVKDERLANRLAAWVDLAGRASVDSRARALAILRHLNGHTDTYFGHVKVMLAQRWRELASVLRVNGRFSITNAPVRDATAALFAWIRCNREDEAKDCQGVFTRVGVSVNDGPTYGSTSDFVRMTLCNYDSTWALVISRLKGL